MPCCQFSPVSALRTPVLTIRISIHEISVFSGDQLCKTMQANNISCLIQHALKIMLTSMGAATVPESMEITFCRIFKGALILS